MTILVLKEKLYVYDCEYIDRIIKESEFEGIPSIEGKTLIINGPAYNDILELANWQSKCTLV